MVCLSIEDREQNDVDDDDDNKMQTQTYDGKKLVKFITKTTANNK